MRNDNCAVRFGNQFRNSYKPRILISWFKGKLRNWNDRSKYLFEISQDIRYYSRSSSYLIINNNWEKSWEPFHNFFWTVLVSFSNVPKIIQKVSKQLRNFSRIPDLGTNSGLFLKQIFSVINWCAKKFYFIEKNKFCLKLVRKLEFFQILWKNRQPVEEYCLLLLNYSPKIVHCGASSGSMQIWHDSRLHDSPTYCTWYFL